MVENFWLDMCQEEASHMMSMIQFLTEQNESWKFNLKN